MKDSIVICAINMSTVFFCLECLPFYLCIYGLAYVSVCKKGNILQKRPCMCAKKRTG